MNWRKQAGLEHLPLGSVEEGRTADCQNAHYQKLVDSRADEQIQLTSQPYCPGSHSGPAGSIAPTGDASVVDALGLVQSHCFALETRQSHCYRAGMIQSQWNKWGSVVFAA